MANDLRKAAADPDPQFPLKPIPFGEGMWFYEESAGLFVVMKGHHGKIPWRKVCAAVDRYRAIRAKGAGKKTKSIQESPTA